MSSSETDDVATLPTVAALDVCAVVKEERRGASIQLDDSYFRGQELAVGAVETASRLTQRRDIAAQSRQLYDEIQLDFDSLTRDNLRAASTQFQELLRRLPEVCYLRRHSPGTCFVIPEWMRSRGKVNYGARIYFFREDDAPAPTDVLERNIEAVVTGDRAGFERYQGALHGYPECCIDYFSGHERGERTGPEVQAVEQIAEYIDESAMPEGDLPSTPTDAIVDGIFETPQVYAFFAREFFQNPTVIAPATVESPSTTLFVIRIRNAWSKTTSESTRDGVI